MANLTHDSELMVQHVAAIAVPNSSRFVTVKDELGNPMIFSLGTDQKLHLIKTNKDGERVLIDFGALLRLADNYKVYAFDVAQNVDSTLYIILATQSVASGSDIIVLSPFKPSSYDLAEYTTDLRVLMMPQTGTITKTAVKSIYMSNSNTGQDYPSVLFAFQPLDLIDKTQDIARLVVDRSYRGWTIEHDLSLPENAFKVLALQPVNLPMRGLPSLPGFIALYEIQEKLQLIFASTEKISNTYYKASLKCPSGAGTLSSFINASGFTDLVVGGEGLYHFKAAQCLIKGAEGQLVSNSGVFSSVRQVYVAQSVTQLAIWASSIADGIGYLTADTALVDPGTPVQVIPDSQGGQFSPFKASSGIPEQFIVANRHGVLSLLQQCNVTGLWNATPFFTPALETTVEIRSYTTQITISDPDNVPLVDCEVMLRSSGLVSIIANGRQIVTGPIGVPVKTDQSGLITLIIPTEDISSHTFTVTGAVRELKGQSFDVDPTEKINAELDKIHSARDLTSIKLSSGEKLLEGTRLRPEEIEQVAKAIEALQSTRKDTIKQRSTKGLPWHMTPKGHPKAPRLSSLIGFRPEKIAKFGDGFIDMAWDAWHWLEGMVSKVVSWSVEKLQQGAAFFVQIGEEVYRWLLDGLAEIGKALSWILDKVLEIGSKVIEWLGFIFDWKDIQATQRSIVHLANDALTSGLGYMDGLESKVDGFFNGIVEELKKESTQTRPEIIDKATANGESGTSVPDDKTSSTKANWAQYQFSHGGGADSSVIHGEQGESGPLETLWTQVIKPLFETLKGLVEEIAGIACRLFFFTNDKSISVQEAMKELKTTVLVEFVDGIRKVAVGIVKLGKSLINEFKELINYKITIPVFSALYKKFISGGTDLTLLDGLALILAIPITIIMKVITGKAPPDMTSVSYGQIIDGNVTDPQQLLEFNQFNSVSNLVGNGLSGLISTVSMMTSGPMNTRTSTAPRGGLAPKIDRAEMMILARSNAVKGRMDGAQKYLKDVFGVIARIASIPTDPNLPSYALRWISWVLSCISTVISIALRRITSTATVAVEKALAVIQGALATINYALIVTIKSIEFQTADFPGKDNTYTLLKLVSGTFDLLGTLSDDVGHLAVDPETKGWAGVCSLAAQALSYNIEGGVVAVKLFRGEYNDIIGRVL